MTPPIDDFLSYWAAGRLLAHGANPYDVTAILRMEQSAGFPYDTPLLVWYPPWILVLAVPFGILPYWPARVLWLIFQVGAVIWATQFAWRTVEPSRPIPWAVALAFAPVWLSGFEGQFTPFVLLGLAGFLYFASRGFDWPASASLVLLTAKPMLFPLVWLALAVWAFTERRWRVVAGGCLGLGALLLIALWLNPHALTDWLTFSRAVSPLAQTYTATIGAVLRALFGQERHWLVYLPMLAGVGWWLWAGRPSQLHDIAGRVLLVSLLTAPFAWAMDYLVLLPAILWAWSPRRDVPIWIIANTIAVGLFAVLRYHQTWYLLGLLALGVSSGLLRSAARVPRQSVTL